MLATKLQAGEDYCSKFDKESCNGSFLMGSTSSADQTVKLYNSEMDKWVLNIFASLPTLWAIRLNMDMGTQSAPSDIASEQFVP